MIHAGIVGATGYAGSELVRLLLSHPEAEVTAISSVSFEGKAISEVYPAYFNLCDMVCETAGQVVDKCDVVFAALPHGLSQELAKACASTHAFNGPPIIEPNGIACNALVATCDGVLSTAIIIVFLNCYLIVFLFCKLTMQR